MSNLDHGILNLPLGHRARGGSLDRQIDRACSEIARDNERRNKAIRKTVAEQKVHVKRLLSELSDERVLQLAKPLGAKKPSTARVALYRVATSRLSAWVEGLSRELAK